MDAVCANETLKQMDVSVFITDHTTKSHITSELHSQIRDLGDDEDENLMNQVLCQTRLVCKVN